MWGIKMYDDPNILEFPMQGSDRARLRIIERRMRLLETRCERMSKVLVYVTGLNLLLVSVMIILS